MKTRSKNTCPGHLTLGETNVTAEQGWWVRKGPDPKEATLRHFIVILRTLGRILNMGLIRSDLHFERITLAV